MLQRFLEQQPAVTSALLSNEVRVNEKDISTLNEADITAAEEIVAAIKPMKIATVVMEEEKTPTLSAVAPVHAHQNSRRAQMTLRPSPHVPKRSFPPPFSLASFQEYLRTNGSISTRLNTLLHIPGL